jgi:hypothetical protein
VNLLFHLLGGVKMMKSAELSSFLLLKVTITGHPFFCGELQGILAGGSV